MKTRQPPGRRVAGLNAAVSLGLVLLLAGFALATTPPAPPGIAAFAPQASKPITKAPSGQAGSSGAAAQGCSSSPTCAEATRGPSGARRGGVPIGSSPTGTGAPSALQCYRWPDDSVTQTADPQSPPCVASWPGAAGGNGGATTSGVTASEVRVAVTDATGYGVDRAAVTALFAHFNRRYELYGRQLTPVFVASPGTFADLQDPTTLHAYAKKLIAVTPFGVASVLTSAASAGMYQRLADAGVQSVVAKAPGFGSEVLSNGLTWSVEPPLDANLRAGAQFVCRALNGRPPRHAGADVQAASPTRRFAVVVLNERSARPDPGPLESGLRGCGADFKVFDAPLYTSGTEYETLMAQLKVDRFTTVIPMGAGIGVNLYQAATKAGYFPEWLDATGLTHLELWWSDANRSFTGGHAEHAFGVTPQVRLRPAAEEPAVWAVKEGGSSSRADALYRSLLVLASGIQGAGPKLTDETFAQALNTTEFPNPDAGGPPSFQQRVGFGSGDQAFDDDYAIWWWNDAAPSQTSASSSGRGSFCYLNRGGRFTPDTFPADADSRLFQEQPCR